jgi:hypothetical protein
MLVRLAPKQVVLLARCWDASSCKWMWAMLASGINVADPAAIDSAACLTAHSHLHAVTAAAMAAA